MNDNIVDLQDEVAKRRILDSVESQGEHVHDNHEYLSMKYLSCNSRCARFTAI